MDYSLITEEILDARYDEILPSLRSVLESEQTQRITANIAREHFLDGDKSFILEQLVGLVFLGFVPLRTIAKELEEQLFLNYEHARVLANELYNRIFAPYEEEINEAYKPAEEVIAEQEQISEVINTKKETGEEPIPLQEEDIRPSFFDQAQKETPIKVEKSEDAPLILQEEPTFFNREKSDRPKSFETPFSKFFPTSSESQEKSTVHAKVETGNFNPLSFLKGEGKKEAHYSELRSNLKPAFGPEEEVISLDAIEKREEINSKPTPIQKKEEPVQAIKPQSSFTAPEVITISPSISKAPQQFSNVPPPVGTPEKSSWLSGLFKKKEKEDLSPSVPQITITGFSDSKPDSLGENNSPKIDGNVLHLK